MSESTALFFSFVIAAVVTWSAYLSLRVYSLQCESDAQNDLIILLLDHDHETRKWLLRLDPPDNQNETAIDKASRERWLRKEKWE